MRLLTTNDLHLASRGPGSRVDDWHATVSRKLAFIEATARVREVDGIAIAGDLFHATTLAYQAGQHAPMTEALEYFKRLSATWPVYIVAGNHDLPHNRIDLVDASPLGVLMAAGVVTPVWQAPAFAKLGTWVGSHPSWVAGVNYPVTEAAVRRWADTPGDGIMLVHSFASVGGGESWGERSFAYPDLAQWCPNVKVWVFGHDHTDHGVVKLGDVSFVQLGAPLRGTLAEDEVTRQPKIAIVDSSGAVEVIDIPIEPAEKVFDLARRDVIPASTRLDEYVQHLSAVQPTLAEGAEVVTEEMVTLSGCVEGRFGVDAVLSRMRGYLRAAYASELQ